MSLKPAISDTDLLRTQMQLLSDAGESAYFIAIFTVALITFSLWNDVSPLYLLPWAGVLLAITLLRYVHFRTLSLNQEDEVLLAFRRWFSIGTLISAFAWGGLSLFILLIGNDLKQALIGVVALAITSCSIIVLSSLVNLARASVVISLAPVAGALTILGGEFLTLAFLIVACCVFLNYLVMSMNRSATSSYIAQVENKRLIQQLQESKDNSEAVNRQLKTEIGVRNEAEASMVEARDNAEQAARAKSDFLATMSHEIRTPMNGVLGMTELLMNTELSPKQHRFADTIRRSEEALLAIINDILDFSKIDAGKLEIQHTVFDLRQLVEDTGAFFAEAAQKKRIELVANFPPDGHPAYRGDPDRIRQVILNLIGNALKFTKHGEVSIQVANIQTNEEQSIIKFLIKDSGIGIPLAHQSHIFESFQQADASTTRKFGGTGLGLAICSRLVNLMGGEIGVESTGGQGSTFWFTASLTPVAASAISSNVKNNLNLKGLTALIVDDNETNRDVLEHQLSNWGMKTTAASSGQVALKLLNHAIDSRSVFDLIILDRQMPEMDGVELAQRIRKNKHTKSMAIVMLSSINQLEETGHWYAAGIDVYVNKPIRQAELYEALGIALEEKNKISAREGANDDSNIEQTNQILNARVPVAEDNPINQELARTILEAMGCSVVVVEDGRQAVDAVTNTPLDRVQNSYDLVLMDCQMPELDGYQATQKIRDWELNSDEDKQSEFLPIIALTANAMSGDRERCLDAGMDDYLTKPFTQEALGAMCQKWLSLEKTVEQQIAITTTNKAQQAKASNRLSSANLDAGALDNIRKLQRDGGLDILAKIINLYLKNAPPMLEKLQEATSTGNAELLRGMAHSMKSSSAYLGAKTLADLYRELETMGREKNMDSAMATLGILEFEFESVCDALQGELEEAAA